MSFQPPTTTTATSTGFSFGLATQAAPKQSFSFGSTGGGGDAGLGSAGFNSSTTTAAPPTTDTTSISQSAANPSSTTANFSFGSAPAATSTAPSFSMPKTSAALATPAAAVPPNTTTTSTTGGPANLTTAIKTTDSAAVVNATNISYNQLEEHINKWTLELQEHEKVFTDQATQINAWDKILIGNNGSILELYDAVQKVKADQQTLEQELEFIATQHKELEESIAPLEKEIIKIPQVDVERSQTYLLVENLDTQLKQMAEDLKEIIDNLNESNKGQNNNDPIIQIGKILNAHMTSLQWIESSSSKICDKLDDVTKMHETFKRECERSFRSAYYK